MTESNPEENSSLKLRTARTLKWNTIDRLASQVLYAVVGIVLANILTQEDFGLVSAIAVFQAFALIFADSGFGAALLQLKDPTQRDYSTVFWFNLVVSVLIYIGLWFGAPLIAEFYDNETRLIPLSKVMFLTFVLTALSIVQINRLMKRMDVKMIAVSNFVAQIIGGIVGIILAVRGFGAWAVVWQSVTLAAIKTIILWATGKWLPTGFISLESFKRIWRVGLSVFSSQMLNTFFLNVYTFVIGKMTTMRQLGIYSQADKWSKMGTASLSQVLTASFVPLLAKVQDSPADFHRYVRKINRFTAFILFPAMFGLAAVGAPLFHTLFGNKWDVAIPLFQILAVRGIFVVFVSLHGNYLLAKGFGKKLFTVEVVKDSAVAVAIAATFYSRDLTLIVWGQMAASVVTFAFVSQLTMRSIGYSWHEWLADNFVFAVAAIAMGGVVVALSFLSIPSVLTFLIQVLAGAAIYCAILYVTKVPELSEAAKYVSSHMK